MESVSVRTAGQEICARSRHAQVCVAGMVYVYQTGAVSAIQNILGKIAGKNDAQEPTCTMPKQNAVTWLTALNDTTFKS